MKLLKIILEVIWMLGWWGAAAFGIFFAVAFCDAPGATLLTCGGMGLVFTSPLIFIGAIPALVHLLIKKK